MMHWLPDRNQEWGRKDLEEDLHGASFWWHANHFSELILVRSEHVQPAWQQETY